MKPGPTQSTADSIDPAREPRGVWTGTALQVLGRVWSATCTLATFFLLSRHLSEADFGRFTFYLAVFAWLDSLANLGTGAAAVQRTATSPDAVLAVLAAGRRIRILAGSLGVLLVGGWALARGEPGAPWILAASFYPITHSLELSTIVFRNRISWRVPVTIRAIASALSLTFVASLWLADVDDPAIFLFGVALGSTVGNWLLHRVSRTQLPKATAEVRPAPGLFRDALPLGLSALCAQLYFYVDNLFVRAICGEAELGHYNVAVRFMSLLIMIAQYSSLAALPWLARCHKDGALGAAIDRVGPPMFAAAGLVAGALLPWTREMLELFRPGNGVASASLRWLLGATVAIYAGSVVLTALVATGANRTLFAISAAALAINVGANVWAVPRWGITGAGLTTFATEGAVAIGGAIALGRAGVLRWSARSWRWLGGPVAFAIGAALSSLAHGA